MFKVWVRASKNRSDFPAGGWYTFTKIDFLLSRNLNSNICNSIWESDIQRSRCSLMIASSQITQPKKYTHIEIPILQYTSQNIHLKNEYSSRNPHLENPHLEKIDF